MRNSSSTPLLLLTLVCAMSGGAMAHGYLAIPPSRTLLAHNAGLEWDHMSLNGGGEASRMCRPPRPVQI